MLFTHLLKLLIRASERAKRATLTKISCGIPVVIPHSCTTGNTIENTTGKYHRKIPQENTTGKYHKIILWFFCPLPQDLTKISCGIPVVIPHSCTTGNTTGKYHRKIPQNNPVVFLPITTGLPQDNTTQQLPHRSTTQQNHTSISTTQNYHSNTTHQYHTAIPHIITTQQYHIAAIPHTITTQQYHTALPHNSTT